MYKSAKLWQQGIFKLIWRKVKLFSSLGLNITFLQDFSKSASSLPVSDLVIDLPLPHLLSTSLFLVAIPARIVFVNFSGYQKCVFCVWVALRPLDIRPPLESKYCSCHGRRVPNWSPLIDRWTDREHTENRQIVKITYVWVGWHKNERVSFLFGVLSFFK